MSEAVLLVGTKKGLWIGRSDERRQKWEFGKPEFLMEGIYATCIDTRGSDSAGLRQRHQRALGSGCLPLRRPRSDLDRDPGSGGPLPDRPGRSVERVWQIQPSPADPDVVWAGTQPSALFRSTDRGESFELVRSLWDHPHRPDWGAGFGGQAIHTIVPDPTDPRAGHGGHVDRRGLPHRGRRRVLEPVQHRHQGLLLPRPVAGVRPVRAQGGLAPRPARADVRPEPPRRLPLRRRRDHLDLDRRRAAGRLRVPDRGAPARPGDRLRLPAGRRRRADPTRRRGAGLALHRRRADLDRVAAAACRTASTPRSCATR